MKTRHRSTTPPVCRELAHHACHKKEIEREGERERGMGYRVNSIEVGPLVSGSGREGDGDSTVYNLLRTHDLMGLGFGLADRLTRQTKLWPVVVGQGVEKAE